MNYSTLALQTIDITKKCAEMILEERNKLQSLNVVEKSDFDFVTRIDRLSEEFLVENLEKLLPNCGFWGEEGVRKQEIKEYTWIIDPIDGTTNFIHNLPLYCISIALMHQDEIVLGVVNEVPSGRIFYSYKDGKSYLNNREIEVSNREQLKNCLLVTGFPPGSYPQSEAFVKLFQKLTDHTHGVRRLGSAAIDLCYVAIGWLDGFYEVNLKPWDVAAGALIVKNAGGKVSDFYNEDNYIWGKEIIADNGHIHNELVEELMPLRER
jgi:myo-inositol-1(or 4)-monophosphatase